MLAVTVVSLVFGMACRRVTLDRSDRATVGSASSRPTGAPKPSPLDATTTHYFPSDFGKNERRPLLVYLHGLGGSGRGAFDQLRLAEFGRRQRVFVVAPDGDRDSVGRRFWNAHPACCDFDGASPNDVARLERLISRLVSGERIDPNKVFVVGFSNGGFMAHRLGCRLGRQLAGIASIAGAGVAEDQLCRKDGELRVVEIHGDADRIVRYQGGGVFDRPGPTHDSASATLQRWGRILECAGEPETGPGLDLDPRLAGAETTVLTLVSCRRGSAALWTVRGGGHALAGLPGLIQRVWAYLTDASASP
jgi:polyhydroxybutyrate depolymerase